MKTNEFSWNTAAGVNIFGRDWAPEGNMRGVLCLVHGLGEHSGRYHHVARWLGEAGYAMVGFDLPGHGHSGGARGYSSYYEISAEIDRLLHETATRYPGLPRFLYGHSLGGALVLYHILKCRPAVQGAIVTSPGLRTGQPVAASKLFLAKVMARLMPSFSMNNGLDLKNLAQDKEVIRLYQNDPLVHDRITAKLGLDILSRGEWILENANEFPVPLLLMQGSADTIVSTAATAQFANSAPAEKLTYRAWEGFYHETHNEPEKKQVLQAIQTWLDQQTGAAD